MSCRPDSGTGFSAAPSRHRPPAREKRGMHCNCGHERSPESDALPMARSQIRSRLARSFAQQRHGIDLSLVRICRLAKPRCPQRIPANQPRLTCRAMAVWSPGSNRLIRKIGTPLRPNLPRALPAASAPTVIRSCRACLTLPKSAEAAKTRVGIDLAAAARDRRSVVDGPAVRREHALVHRLRKRRVRKHRAHEVGFGGFKLPSDDEPLD